MSKVLIKILFSISFFLFFIVLSSFFSKSYSQSCTDDSQCTGGEVCAYPGPGLCYECDINRPETCPPGWMCQNFSCVTEGSEPCTINSQCTSNCGGTCVGGFCEYTGLDENGCSCTGVTDECSACTGCNERTTWLENCTNYSGCTVVSGGSTSFDGSCASLCPPETPCANAGGNCQNFECAEGWTDLGYAYGECTGANMGYCCVPGGGPNPEPGSNCADLGGSCLISCNAGDINLGRNDCVGGTTCCLPQPVNITVNVVKDLNRNMAKESGEDYPGISVRVEGATAYLGTTNATGTYTLSNVQKGVYTVTISGYPADYEVLNGTNVKTADGSAGDVTVTFYVAPIARRLTGLTVIADTDPIIDGIALGSYGTSGLRTNESGSNYYNALKLLQKVNVVDATDKNKINLIGIAFTSRTSLPSSGTLSALKTSASTGTGFVALYVMNDVSNSTIGGPAASACPNGQYNFCQGYYYVYFNNTWQSVSAAQATMNMTTSGLKVLSRNITNPASYPGDIIVRFTTYMYKIMGSRTFATYGYMFDANGTETVLREKACDQTTPVPVCTAE